MGIFQLIGGIILSYGYIPQIIQIIKTKSVKDLNMKYLLMVFIGIALMEIYAVNLVVNGSGLMYLITNSISVILSLTMVVLKLIYQSLSVKYQILPINISESPYSTIKQVSEEVKDGLENFNGTYI